jgi:hypothetical protein
MTKFQQNRYGTIRLMTVVLFICFASFGFFNNFAVSKISGFALKATPTPGKKSETQTQPKKAKYTEFPHNASQHSNLACSSCHKFPSANWKRVRKKSEAFPDVTDYPKHESCLNCHRQQFFGSAKPMICSICHTNPSPRNSARHPFANPREIFDLSPKGKRAVSDFSISFPHDKHTEEGEKSCSSCHQTYQPQGVSDDEFVTKPPANRGDGFWLKKGTFKSVPVSHAACFACHSPDTGILPAPTACAACHKLAPKLPNSDFDPKIAATIGDLDKITLLAWRNRDSSGKFRHEASSHADLECATCHNAAAINTLDFSSKKVAIASCNMCHITETSDDGGILNFEIDSRKKDARFQCVKCHLSFGKLPIPESHLKAIPGK